MAVVDELIAVLGYELRGEANLNRFQQGLARVQRGATVMAAAVARGATIAAGAMAAGGAALGRSVLKISGEFEKYQLVLETIEGSAEKARQSMDWITQFAATTPYELAGVTDAFVKLKAYGIDPIADDTLRILGDTASAMGKPLQQAVEALADAQTGEFERMKEFGLKASQAGDEVTFRWSKNGEEMTRTVRKNSEEIRRFILENFGERFSGAMEKQSRGWEGMLSNLSDTWTNFRASIGAAGMFDYAKAQLKGLLDWIASKQADGSWDRWAKSISDAYIAVAEATGGFARRMKGHFDFLANLTDVDKERLQDWWDTWKWVLGGIFALMFPVLTVLIGLGLAVEDFLTYLQGGESVIGDFIAWVQELIPVSEQVATAMAGMGAAIAAGLVLKPGLIVRFAAGIAALLAGLVSAPVLLAGLAIAGVGLILAAKWDEITAWWDSTITPWIEEKKAAVSDFFAGVQEKRQENRDSFDPNWRDKLQGELPEQAYPGGASYGPPRRGGPRGDSADFKAALSALSALSTNLGANLGAMDQGAATQEIVNDSRDQSSHVQVSVTQNVALTEASTAAAGAVANATGSAAAAAATPARSGGGGGR